jgi:hypothetical protein
MNARRRETVRRKPTPLPRRAFAELIPCWSRRRGHRDDRGVWRAILRRRLDRIPGAGSGFARPRAAQGRRPTMPRVLVERDSAANRCTSFIAAQTTADGDTGVASSTTLPCATSSWAIVVRLWMPVTRGVHPRVNCTARSEASTTNLNFPMSDGRWITVFLPHSRALVRAWASGRRAQKSRSLMITLMDAIG